MEAIAQSPGLQHISEDIFKLLDKKSLINCREVNSSWKNVLDEPIFWLKKYEGAYPSSDVPKTWKTLAQELEGEKLVNEFVLALMKVWQWRKIMPFQFIKYLLESNKYPDLIEFILEHENPMSKLGRVFVNGTCMWNPRPIHFAALYGFTHVVGKITKMMESPIIKETQWGRNPIHFAAKKGHLDCVQILVGFTDTPLAVDDVGETPIHEAARRGHLDIVQYLVGFTDKPNNPNICCLYDYCKNKLHK